MCGRYFLKYAPKEIRNAFPDNWDWRLPQFPDLVNIDDLRPTQQLPVARTLDHDQCVEILTWGITRPIQGKPKQMINARAESLRKYFEWKRAIAHRRCLIPASGWYEWTGERGSKTKYRYAPKESDFLTFGGLWFKEDDADQFVIITTPAGKNNTYRGNALHHRMPLIIHPDSYGEWLDAELESPSDLIEPQMMDLFDIEIAR